MVKLSAMLDRVAESLERKGLLEEAKGLDVVSNTVEAAYSRCRRVDGNTDVRSLSSGDIGSCENVAEHLEDLLKALEAEDHKQPPGFLFSTEVNMAVGAARLVLKQYKQQQRMKT